MTPRPFLAALTLTALLALAACDGRSSGDNGTMLSITAKGENGSDVAINTDGSGKVNVNIPGFSASVNLPKVALDHGNFDIDGVKLYPGSTVSSIKVDAARNDSDRRSDVSVAFRSPAKPDVVRDWFKKAFHDKSVAVRDTGAATLDGVSRDGDAFQMTFAPEGTGATAGTVAIHGKD